MPNLSFYHDLCEDFINSEYTSYTIEGKQYNGLTPQGFFGTRKLNLDNFRVLELVAAIDTACCFFHKSKNSRIIISSFDLCELFEKFLYQETDGIIFDIKNGEVILAMIYQGYEPIKVKGSKEVFFKVTRRELSKIQMYIELASSRN